MKRIVILLFSVLILSGCSNQTDLGITKSEYATYDEYIECVEDGNYEVYDSNFSLLAQYYCYDQDMIYKEYYVHHENENGEIETLTYDNYSKRSLFGTIYPSQEYSSYSTYRGLTISKSRYNGNKLITVNTIEILSDTTDKMEYIERCLVSQVIAKK